jgi:hypothetical protein
MTTRRESDRSNLDATIAMHELNEPKCPICKGDSFLLGYLGKLAWFSCRYCGWQHSAPAIRHDDDNEQEELQ